MSIIVDNKFGVFIGERMGECVRVTLPAITDNEWGSKTPFLSLPLMDKETFDNFVRVVNKIQKEWE